MHMLLLLHFTGHLAIATALNVAQEWIIGLRETQTLEDHFATIGEHVEIEQHIPGINGYAINPSTNDKSILASIRRDPGVGFVVEKPRGFFSENGHTGLKGDDLDAYEDERMWLTLQDQDPEVEVTDDGATQVHLHFPSSLPLTISSKIPLKWRIFFTDEAAKEEHIATFGQSLQSYYVLKRSYWVVFDNDAHEKEYLSMIKNDPRVTAVYPERERQGIFYDEDESTHLEPYVDYYIIIHEVRIR